MIRKALEVLPEGLRWCVELGAWDGRYLSNTHRLMAEEGWSGVFIEADSRRFAELRETYEGSDRAYCINTLATFEGSSTLDDLLASTPIPEDFELLSLDVDGNDYHLGASLRRYRPRLVVVEFNATFPNDVDSVQEADLEVHHGSSLAAFVRLGREKGYELIATSDANAFFVLTKHFELFGIDDNSIDAIHTNRAFQTRVFSALRRYAALGGLHESALARCGLTARAASAHSSWLALPARHRADGAGRPLAAPLPTPVGLAAGTLSTLRSAGRELVKPRRFTRFGW